MAEPTPPRSNSTFSAGVDAAGGLPPASVAAGNGLTWWTEGWRLFAASPWVWIAITLAFIVITILLSLIPLIGSFASTVLTPAFAAGIMAGCRAQDGGGELSINHLFAG